MLQFDSSADQVWSQEGGCKTLIHGRMRGKSDLKWLLCLFNCMSSKKLYKKFLEWIQEKETY